MRCRSLVPAVVWFILGGSIVSRDLCAQGNTDLEGRFIVHLQRAPDQGMGIAGWFILPEVVRNSPAKALLLVGVMEAWEGRWLELMGGVLRIGDKIQPVVNLRFSKSDLEYLDFFLELQHNTSTHTFYVNPIANIPLRIDGFGFKAGIELDWFLHPQSEAFFFGPRVSTSIAISDVVKSIQVTAAYKLRRGGSSIVRLYLLLNV